MKLRSLALGVSAVALLSSPCYADLGYTQGGVSAGAAAVIFDFLCFSGAKHCSAHVPITSAGLELFTVSNPVNVTNSALPVSQSTTWPVRVQDGSGNALTSATRGSERPLSVQILDGSGNQITTFGGSGGTASNIGSAYPSSATAVGFNDGTNMRGARVYDADTGGGTEYTLGTLLRQSGSGGSVEVGTVANPLNVTVASITNSTGGAAGSTAPTNAGMAGFLAKTVEPVAVTDGQLVRGMADTMGKQVVLPYSNPENFISGITGSAMTSTTSTQLIAAPGSGLRNYVTHIVCSNSHVTVGTDVDVRDGNGGTVLYTLPAAAVYGGASIPLPTPLRQPSTNVRLDVANVTSGASVRCAASGYKGA
jgi:hypothetical protein